MGMIASTLNSGLGGYLIYDVASPNVVGPAVINSYTTLTNPAYWRAQSFKANNMASFPKSIQLNGVDAPHYLNRILQRRPNNYQGSAIFWRTTYFNRSHYANAFTEIRRSKTGNKVDSLHIIRPEFILPFRWIDDEGETWTYYYIGGSNPHVVQSADMIHFTGLSYDGLSGLNPMFVQLETLQRAQLVNDYTSRFLKKGGMVRGSIEIPAGASEDQQKTIVATLQNYFSGANAERDVIVLTDGAKLTNNSLSAKEAQLADLQNLTEKQLAQITDVPPVFLFNDSNAKYNDAVEESYQMVVRDLFRPMIEQDEAELSEKLLSEAELDAGYRVHIDPNALIRGNTETESTVICQQKTAGIVSTNEARLVLGYGPTGNADDDEVKTLGDSTAKAQPAAQQAPGEKKNSQTTIGIERFHELLDDVADRISTKTSKATANATKTGKDLTVWGNIFSAEQTSYAADAVRPILSAMNPDMDAATTAKQIGEKYGARLRQHFAALKREEPSEQPELKEIILNTVGDNAETATPAIQ